MAQEDESKAKSIYDRSLDVLLSEVEPNEKYNTMIELKTDNQFERWINYY